MPKFGRTAGVTVAGIVAAAAIAAASRSLEAQDPAPPELRYTGREPGARSHVSADFVTCTLVRCADVATLGLETRAAGGLSLRSSVAFQELAAPMLGVRRVLSRNDLVFTTRGVTSMLGVVSGPPPSTRMPIGDLIPGLELAQVYRLRLVEIGTSIAGGTSRAFAPPSASRQQITIRQSGDGLRADTSVAVDGGDGRWSSAEARFTYRDPKWAMTVRLGRLGVSTRGSSIWGGVQVGAPLGRGATLTAGAATASRLLYAEGIGSGRHTINLGLGFNTSLFAPSSRGAAPEASRPAFSVTRSVGDSYRIAIHLEGAHAVDFASDATGWQPRAMTRSGDDWILDLPIARGVHHANIRVDAEEWIVPPGLTPVDDDFAGHVGAFVVE